MLGILALLLGQAGPDWVRVVTDGDRIVEIDRRSIGGTRQRPEVWTRYVAPDGAVETRMRIDCAARTITRLQFVDLASDGRITGRESIPEWRQTADAVRSGSVGEAVVRAAC